MPIDKLSMQGVADRLGVDRKALSHHVGSRAGLLKLLALDSFKGEFSLDQITSCESWREACHVYVRSFVSATIQAGPLIDYIEVDTVQTGWFLEVTDALLGHLYAAGFDDETTQRSMVLLTNFCFSHSRDYVRSLSGEQLRRIEVLRRSLALVEAGESVDRFPNLQRIGQQPPDATYGESQLQFGLKVLLDGMEAQLPKH